MSNSQLAHVQYWVALTTPTLELAYASPDRYQAWTGKEGFEIGTYTGHHGVVWYVTQVTGGNLSVRGKTLPETLRKAGLLM